MNFTSVLSGKAQFQYNITVERHPLNNCYTVSITLEQIRCIITLSAIFNEISEPVGWMTMMRCEAKRRV